MSAPTWEQVWEWVLQSAEEGAVDSTLRFATLAYSAGAEKARADYEREHCRHVVPLPDALQAMIAEAVAAEREACAKVCDSLEDEYREQEYHRWPELRTDAQTGACDCATAIRARSNKHQKETS